MMAIMNSSPSRVNPLWQGAAGDGRLTIGIGLSAVCDGELNL
jgi:hypothetical protein